MVKVINGAQDKKDSIYVEHEDITIKELILQLHIEDASIGAVLVDGSPRKLSDKFDDNSEIYLLPVLCGG